MGTRITDRSAKPAMETSELDAWARSRGLSAADLAQLRAVFEERDEAIAAQAALFAHVCRLAGTDPRRAPEEIRATIDAYEAKQRRAVDALRAELAERVADRTAMLAKEADLRAQLAQGDAGRAELERERGEMNAALRAEIEARQGQHFETEAQRCELKEVRRLYELARVGVVQVLAQEVVRGVRRPRLFQGAAMSGKAGAG